MTYIEPTIRNQIIIERHAGELLQKQTSVYEALMKQVHQIAENFKRDLESAKKYQGYYCLKRIDDPLYIIYNSIVLLNQMAHKGIAYTNACHKLGIEFLLKSLEKELKLDQEKRITTNEIHDKAYKTAASLYFNMHDLKNPEDINKMTTYCVRIGEIVCEILEEYNVLNVYQINKNDQRMFSLNKGLQEIAPIGSLPMIVPPKDRNNENMFEGGYLEYITPLVKPNPSINTKIDLYNCNAINILQKTPFMINHKMLEFINRQLPNIKKKAEEATEETKKIDLDIYNIKQQRKEEYLNQDKIKDLNKKIFLKNAEKKKWENKINEYKETNLILKHVWFLVENALYFPMNMDTRGRIYYIPEIINPQSFILSRSIIDFAQKTEINKNNFEISLQNLKLIGASYAGKNRMSEKEKIEWIEKNHEKIMNIENEEEFLFKIEDHYLFYRFCIEYQELIKRKDEIMLYERIYESYIICYIDMSCNAVQHYTAITMKKELTHLVNMNENEKPTDIYSFVGHEIIKNITNPEILFLKDTENKEILRKLVKKPIMTYFYGVTDHTIRHQIQEICFKYEIPNADEVTTILSKKLREYFTTNFEKLSIDNYEWKTPTNLIIKQDYKEEKRIIVRCACLYKNKNKKQRNFILYQKTKKTDIRKNKQTILANYVHSMDAAHLNWIIDEYNYDISVIHDSIGVHLTEIPKAKDTVKNTFIKMYKQYHKEKGTEPPEWLDEIAKSKYFIC